MMTELSLHIFDMAENSAAAGASLISISIDVLTSREQLQISVKDNGCGMTAEQVKRACDPFFTSRTTRPAGLGIPFFQYAAEAAGGTFSIESEPGKGTLVTAGFQLSHINRMPLGDINAAVYGLIFCHPDIDFIYHYQYNGRAFTFDTRRIREILGEIPLQTPEVSAFIKTYLTEQKLKADGGAVY